jgi:uncharacterized protein YjiS (DUF1127 family)
MRKDTLNRIYGALTATKRLFHTWKARRAVLLQDYDDHILRDIGLSRMDLRWAA